MARGVAAHADKPPSLSLHHTAQQLAWRRQSWRRADHHYCRRSPRSLARANNRL